MANTEETRAPANVVQDLYDRVLTLLKQFRQEYPETELKDIASDTTEALAKFTQDALAN
jgi:hypothetical protein